jgi:hypothetical protein
VQAKRVTAAPAAAKSASQQAADETPRKGVQAEVRPAAPAAEPQRPASADVGSEGKEKKKPPRKASVKQAVEKQASARDEAPKKQVRAKKAAAKKAAAKKTAAKKTAASRKPAAARMAVKKTPASAADAPVAGSAPEKARVTAKKAPATGKSTGRKQAPPRSSVGASRKKTSGRRGIQLKSLGKSGGDGLN